MLLIYSGDVPQLDALLQRRLASRGELIVIPSSMEDMDAGRELAEHYHTMSLPARVLPLTTYEKADRLRAAVLRAGAVYLAGGNTYEFLAYARRIGLFDTLRMLEEQLGMIAAESAGSILLSPDVSTAAVPARNGDENTPKLTRFSGMGRIPFHVSPHFQPASRYVHSDLAELQDLADRSRRSVVMLEDSQGLVLSGSRIVRRIGFVRTLRPVALVRGSVRQVARPGHPMIKRTSGPRLPQ